MKQVPNSQAFFVLAGSANPKPPIRDNRYHDSCYKFNLFGSVCIPIKVDTSFESTISHNYTIMCRTLHQEEQVIIIESFFFDYILFVEIPID